jgi:hypothetical protein
MKNNGNSGDRPRDMAALWAWRYIRILETAFDRCLRYVQPVFPKPAGGALKRVKLRK